MSLLTSRLSPRRVRKHKKHGVENLRNKLWSTLFSLNLMNKLVILFNSIFQKFFINFNYLQYKNNLMIHKKLKPISFIFFYFTGDL